MDLVSGRNVVKEALRSGTKINRVYIQDGRLQGQILEIMDEIYEKSIPVDKVTREELDGMVAGLHQGIVAEISSFKTYDLTEVLQAGANKIVVLDEIEDPHNVGAIIRTAEAAGFDAVVIQNRRSSGITNTVHRSSAGASFHINIVEVINITRAINEMKDYNIWVYGADGQANSLYSQVDLKGGVALVIGSEGKGITRLVKENCDALLKIPMYGKVESLNASNAASILIYEVVRQNG